MKKQTALALAAVFSLSVAGTALAAPANPFVDVPAKHWAYDSINKLAKSGVISGYGDGTFKGDKTLTRYEIAVIVGKALANSDKADAETKKALEALKTEFGVELNNLGVRVDNLEKNASKVKFTGEVRERYDYQEDYGNKMQTRLRLKMTAQVDENVTFNGRLASQSTWGNADSANQVKLDQAYISGKAAGLDYSFGRQPIFLGQGLLADVSDNNDGLVLSGGKDVKVTTGSFKRGKSNFVAANIDAKVADDLNVTVSYIKDKDATKAYKSTAAGLSYTGFGKFAISGEYGKNDAKNIDAKAWMAKVKYGNAGAVNTAGVWIGYRNADKDFDPAGLNTLDYGILDGSIGVVDNVKGLEYGVEYTVFKNGVLTFQYNDLEQKNTKIDKKNICAHLVYSF
ncbi:S-layer homology domain-containing protein [Sporomusa sp.]|uniref:S-layer homology domain-containing protein n=1 Tax=Sporomusa sp. TaxID=2078658 RepID=UPI002BF74F91|nr:S-layer homology domain-containing protein [Sporomusa sp.]HWR44312.1 S-layer homology domain-containing protein [Sporomusa sp.]